MGETTRKQQHVAAIRAMAREIAKEATPGVVLDVFRAYALAAGVEKSAGSGWLYPFGRDLLALNGWRKFAAMLAEAGTHPTWGTRLDELVERMADARAVEHGTYITGDVKAAGDRLSMDVTPSSAAKIAAHVNDEQRKLAGYYDADHLPRPLDVVQLPHAAIGVVERVKPGGVALVRRNMVGGDVLSPFDVTDLRSLPPIAFEAAGVPGAIGEGAVPRDFATSELSQRAIMRARRIAPGERLTLAAIKTDDRYEYGRAYVYAIASIIDATRLIAARCDNEQWHESAPARRLQPCAHCDTGGTPSPAEAKSVAPTTDSVRASVFHGALSAMGTVREALVALAVPERPVAEPDPATTDDTSELVERIIRRAQYGALRKVLEVLDGWREGARSNHDALGSHRDERDCWERFETDDIWRMVADAARELRTADPTTGYEKRVVEL